MQPLLPLIERLSLFPAETLLAVPASPEQTLRGVLVLHGLAGQLGREAVTLRREQEALEAATRAVDAEVPKLAAAEAAQQTQAAALDEQIAAARASHTRATDEATDAAQRAAEDSVEGADAARHAGRAGRATASRGGARSRCCPSCGTTEPQTPDRRGAPAAGRPGNPGWRRHPAARPADNPGCGRHHPFLGRAHEGGPAAGVWSRAPPAARVVRALWRPGWCLSAPFRSYGLLLIVDCGAGYHMVLAGFDRIDAEWDSRSPPASLSVSCRRGSQARRAIARRSVTQARRAAGEPGAMARKQLNSHRLRIEHWTAEAVAREKMIFAISCQKARPAPPPMVQAGVRG